MRHIFLLFLITSMAFGEEDPLGLAKRIEAEYFDATIEKGAMLVNRVQDAKADSLNLVPVIEKRDEILKVIKERKLTVQTVEVISERYVGESVVIVRIHRLFDNAFCLSSIILIKRPTGWRINALGIEVTGDVEKFLKKLDPYDVKSK